MESQTLLQSLEPNTDRLYHPDYGLTVVQLAQHLNIVDLDEIYRWVKNDLIDYSLDIHHQLYFNPYQTYMIQRQYNHPTHHIPYQQIKANTHTSDAEIKQLQAEYGITPHATLHDSQLQYRASEGVMLQYELKRHFKHSK